MLIVLYMYVYCIHRVFSIGHVNLFNKVTATDDDEDLMMIMMIVIKRMTANREADTNDQYLLN